MLLEPLRKLIANNFRKSFFQSLSFKLNSVNCTSMILGKSVPDTERVSAQALEL
jgi:hypothetical protein